MRRRSISVDPIKLSALTATFISLSQSIDSTESFGIAALSIAAAIGATLLAAFLTVGNPNHWVSLLPIAIAILSNLVGIFTLLLDRSNIRTGLLSVIRAGSAISVAPAIMRAIHRGERELEDKRWLIVVCLTEVVIGSTTSINAFQKIRIDLLWQSVDVTLVTVAMLMVLRTAYGRKWRQVLRDPGRVSLPREDFLANIVLALRSNFQGTIAVPIAVRRYLITAMFLSFAGLAMLLLVAVPGLIFRINGTAGWILDGITSCATAIFWMRLMLHRWTLAAEAKADDVLFCAFMCFAAIMASIALLDVTLSSHLRSLPEPVKLWIVKS